MIKIEHVHKTYAMDASRVTALTDVSLEIASGEFLAIAGPSGSGKSTLLHIMGCIERPTSGAVTIEGTSINDLTSDQQAQWRAQKLGVVFQTFNLLPVLTAYENIEYPLYLQNRPAAERHKRVRGLLADVGLAAFESHRPAQLSGGQRQRVAIARALAGSPILVLADEPTANLDPKTGTEILALMKELNRKNGVTFIFSTHDARILAQADRVVQISDGRLVTG
jgi:putative ABC transport system ATP-binding protein